MKLIGTNFLITPTSADLFIRSGDDINSFGFQVPEGLEILNISLTYSAKLPGVLIFPEFLLIK